MWTNTHDTPRLAQMNWDKIKAHCQYRTGKRTSQSKPLLSVSEITAKVRALRAEPLGQRALFTQLRRMLIMSGQTDKLKNLRYFQDLAKESDRILTTTDKLYLWSDANRIYIPAAWLKAARITL